MPSTYEPVCGRTVDELLAIIEAHRAVVLVDGVPSDADRELWAAIGLRATPSLSLVGDVSEQRVDRETNWFDTPQDWDSFWSKKR